jgi:hypothetical protein
MLGWREDGLAGQLRILPARPRALRPGATRNRDDRAAVRRYFCGIAPAPDALGATGTAGALNGGALALVPAGTGDAARGI